MDINRGTMDKYWDINEEEYIHSLIENRTRTKILDPYRELIKTQIEDYREITGSIIHDHLLEKILYLGYQPERYGSMWL